MHAFEIFNRIRQKTDSVIVGFSGGKDALAMLDVAHSIFPRVEAYFLWMVPNLSFQERYLAYIERRYKFKLIKMPHFAVADRLRTGFARWHTSATKTPKIKMDDIINAARKKTGIEWAFTGEKICDSLHRRAWLKQSGAVSETRRVAMPLADWSHHNVFAYLKHKQIPLPPDYRLWPKIGSFGPFRAESLVVIREEYPDDFKRIVEFYPFVTAYLKRYEFEQNDQAGKSGATTSDTERAKEDAFSEV